MNDILLEVKQLRASYGKVQALYDIDLQLQRGNIVTVIGPNGAGKSTLLNAIMGVLPSQGSIHYRGQAIERSSLEQRVLSGIALVPERRELFATMTVEDNLVLGGFRRVRLGHADRLRVIPASAGTTHATGRYAVRRRAADAGDRPRLDGQTGAADAG